MNNEIFSCTCNAEYGLYECLHCQIEALQRCKAQNKTAYSKWGAQMREEDPERYQLIKNELEKEK